MRCRHAWWVGVLGGCLAGAVWATGSSASTTSPAPEPLARGWIVKLKESKPQPVVRLAAAAVPSDGPTSQRSRLWQAMQRQRVSMLTHKPTAFGANVVHAGRLLTVAEAEAEARRLRQDPDVEWVEVNVIEQRMSMTPMTANTVTTPLNDPDYASGAFPNQQVWLSARTQARAGIADFPAAWAAMNGQTVYPVTVAVLDTGKLDHPDLDGRLFPGYDFVSELEYARDGNGIDDDPTDPGDYLTLSQKQSGGVLYPNDCDVSDSSWHGFSILNMLGARTNNGVAGAGMLAPLPEGHGRRWVLPVRVGSVCGADRSDIYEGLLWSAGVSYQGAPAFTNNPQPARVISLSYGSEGSCTGTLYPQIVATLRQRGTLLVASAGNGNSNNVGDVTPTVPAACSGVLAVTALHQRGTKASYANFVQTSGSSWGLAVSAGDVSSINDSWVYALSNAGTTTATSSFIMRRLAGTSFAAPQAAGVAALMLALNPGLTVDELLQLITSSAKPWSEVEQDLSDSSQLLSVAGVCALGSTGACRCTSSTCGSGVLDAGRAVQAVLGGLPDTIEPFQPAPVTAGYFTPDRQQSSSGGGGGGGTLSWPWLAGLAALWVIGAVTGRRAGFRTGRP